MNIQLLVSTAMMFTLVGCGGGGGGGGDIGTSPVAPAPVAPTPSAEVIQTRDLIAPEGTDYDPIAMSTLTVDISATTTERAYLTVYEAYTEAENGDLVPHYNSKIASTALNEGKAEIALALCEVEMRYLAEIWFYDGSLPQQVVLNSADGQWVIN
ncbi:hypothetical protein [Thaumasiovibrio subtropicus]|uniref:hypothetical protein n=1 Tax=Thaumasiovibrio subtropicus TaxID=1891207 RepID=UPI000B35D87D|nr:hypothetical protein [Thaumasiovibrio subtropicus]